MGASSDARSWSSAWWRGWCTNIVPSMRRTPASLHSSSILSNCCAERATGFSRSTCLRAAAARATHTMCALVGSGTALGALPPNQRERGSAHACARAREREATAISSHSPERARARAFLRAMLAVPSTPTRNGAAAHSPIARRGTRRTAAAC
eukprot:scaffold203682_cov31-Tisochrysis_lutea.AAC.2